ncbi:MAG: dTMP kinase [Arenicellales bacterium]
MEYGKFISIEGGDGAGKSTQLQVIADVLSEQGIDSVMTREPGGTPIGEALRALLLNKGELNIGDETELLMMYAARAEHVNTVILPALEQGKWVVSDRFEDASFAYQGAKGVAVERIDGLSKWLLAGFKPDLSLLFDLPVEMGLQRSHARGELDRFEQQSLDYKLKVQAIYRLRAENDPTRMRLIDSAQNIDSVSEQVRTEVRAFVQVSQA